MKLRLTSDEALARYERRKKWTPEQRARYEEQKEEVEKAKQYGTDTDNEDNN